MVSSLKAHCVTFSQKIIVQLLSDVKQIRYEAKKIFIAYSQLLFSHMLETYFFPPE